MCKGPTLHVWELNKTNHLWYKGLQEHAQRTKYGDIMCIYLERIMCMGTPMWIQYNVCTKCHTILWMYIGSILRVESEN